MTKFYTLVTYLFNVESFTRLSTELKKLPYAAFSHDNLAIETLSNNNVLTHL